MTAPGLDWSDPWKNMQTHVTRKRTGKAKALHLLLTERLFGKDQLGRSWLENIGRSPLDPMERHFRGGVIRVLASFCLYTNSAPSLTHKFNPK